jgi:integrase
MSRKKKKPALPITVGSKPSTVTAYERGDKGQSVWIRWWNAEKRRYDKRSLGFKARTAGDEFDAELVAKAGAAALDQYKTLIGISAPAAPKAALTVVAGLALATSTESGMWPTDTPHAHQMRLYVPRVLALLPAGITWEDLTPNHYDDLVRTLARRAKAANTESGREVALRFVVLLAQAALWLARGRHLVRGVGAPPDKWKQALVDDWARITGKTHEKFQPRHSPEEMGAIFRALPKADPRIRLAIELAAEARLGQALRCMRSNLDLSEIGGDKLGRFTIPDSVKKMGVTIDLSPSMRATVDESLAGYLSELEKTYQRSGTDYPLFPANRLVKNVARGTSIAPIGKSGALALFHDLERAAGITPVPGRGWYGLRRIASDLAEDHETDGRALNAITGHTSDDMRRNVYQARRRAKVLARASTARQAARNQAIAAADSESPVTPAHTPEDSVGGTRHRGDATTSCRNSI